MPKHITLQQKEDIVKYYTSRPMTTNHVSEIFHISKPKILEILNQYNIPRYTKVQLFSPQLNENYFKEIDTEDKAYFLGLIISDGCIHNTKNKQQLLSITLQEKDKYILEKFLKYIGSNKQVTSDGRGCYGVQILSNIMVNDLKQYGLCENKSLQTIFPNNIPQPLYKHLIRGLIDGDGSISFYDRPNKNAHVKAVRFCQGNKQFIQDMIDFLHKTIYINNIATYQEKDNLWSCAWRKDSDMMQLIDYIYDDATIYMTRKKEKCDLIMQECLKYVDFRSKV